ncbi:MAG TPA: DUF4340 domain-containing protein [Candidatus Omnitrophota bacterium]|nr:DUF4340 domain-containing protein [Candidatus Omnitrophota bacterium]
MSARQIFLLVFILLAILAGIVFRSKRHPPELVSEETASIAPGFAPADVREILIRESSDEIRLVRGETLWQVASLWNAGADQKKIADLLDSVEKLEGEERASGTALFSDFGLGDAEGLHLILKAGPETPLHLILGTKANRLHEIFLRREGDERIFVSSSDLALNLGIYQDPRASKIDPNFWADLSLFSFKPGDVVKAEIREGSAEWREAGSGLPFEKDPKALTKYYESLLAVKAASIADPNGSGYGFETPAWELRLTLSDGSQKTLSVGNPADEKNGGRYVRVSGLNTVFKMSGRALKQIRPDEPRLIRSNPLGIGETSGILRLSVKTPQEKLSLAPKEKSWPELENYVAALRLFGVSRLESSERDKQKKREYRIEVEQDGLPRAQISCSSLEGEKEEAFCVNEESKQGFFVAKPVFQSLFEKLESLKPPADKAPEKTQA